MNDKDTKAVIQAIDLTSQTTTSIAGVLEKIKDHAVRESDKTSRMLNRLGELERQSEKATAAYSDLRKVFRIVDEQLTCQAKWILLASHCLAQVVSLHNVEMDMHERQDIEDEMVATASDLCLACKDMIDKGEAALADAKKYAAEQN